MINLTLMRQESFTPNEGNINLIKRRIGSGDTWREKRQTQRFRDAFADDLISRVVGTGIWVSPGDLQMLFPSELYRSIAILTH
jgi:hypothetical protein